jgi:hypothetical protein
MAIAVLLAAAVLSSACGSGTTTSGASTASLVKAPKQATGVCTFILNGKIPSDEPQGLKPPFGTFDPDPSAIAALQSIKHHGGTGVVDSLTFQEKTKLYAGPDAAAKSVGTIPDSESIVVAEPVVWTDRSGGMWLAFFLACGGDNLYWVSVKQMIQQNPVAGQSLAAFLAQLKAARPYDKTGNASFLPIKINGHQQLVWTDPRVIYEVGRGYLVNL